MGKCIFCGTDLVETEQEFAKKVGCELQKSNDNLLALFIPHIFNYCPKCQMPEVAVTDEELNLLLQNKSNLLATLNNSSLDKIDKENAIRRAETKGLISETLKHYDKAILEYKATVDLLNIYINNYLDEITKNVLNRDGQEFKIMREHDIDSFEYAKDHRDLLNGLIVGLFAKDGVFDKLGTYGLFVYMNALLDCYDCKPNEEIMKFVENLIDSLNNTKLEEKYLPMFDKIKNKFLCFCKDVNN